LELVENMGIDGVSVCSGLGFLEGGRQIHDYMRIEVQRNIRCVGCHSADWSFFWSQRAPPVDFY
jgi:hypothetical protein